MWRGKRPGASRSTSIRVSSPSRMIAMRHRFGRGGDPAQAIFVDRVVEFARRLRATSLRRRPPSGRAARSGRSRRAASSPAGPAIRQPCESQPQRRPRFASPAALRSACARLHCALQFHRARIERLAVEPGRLGDLRGGLRRLVMLQRGAQQRIGIDIAGAAARPAGRPAARSRPWADARRNARSSSAAVPVRHSSCSLVNSRATATSRPGRQLADRLPAISPGAARFRRTPASPARRASSASASARALSFAGRKPANRKRSFGRPESVSADHRRARPRQARDRQFPLSRASRTRR